MVMIGLRIVFLSVDSTFTEGLQISGQAQPLLPRVAPPAEPRYHEVSLRRGMPPFHRHHLCRRAKSAGMRNEEPSGLVAGFSINET